MKTLFIAVLMGLACLLARAATAAEDVSAKRTEIRHSADTSLAKFYAAQPRIKSEVARAPGYAVFTTYGLSFLVGGAGGAGVAHDAAAKKDTYMNMAEASAGPQAGITQRQVLLVFKTRKAFDDFVSKGWELGGGGAAAAGADGKTAGGGTGEQFVNDAIVYTYVKNGVELGANLSGTKFWKDKDLN